MPPPPKDSRTLPLGGATDGSCFLGVDVGGTNIKIGLVDDSGRTLASESIATGDSKGARQALELAAVTCRRLADEAAIPWRRVARAGLATPGPMDLNRGMVLNPTNLPGWTHFPVRDVLSEQLGVPVSFINDANAAAFGEFWAGHGPGHRSFALFTLGTGVGGGLIVNGQLIHGVNSFGSELGHVIVDSRPDARLCTWGGGLGQLEAYASASAVAAQAELGIRAGRETVLRHAAADRPVTAKDVHEAALRDDAFAWELIDEAAFYLGVGVTSVVHLSDPGLVVLGGAMNFGGAACHVGQRFLAGVVAEFKRRTFPNVFEGTKFEYATLGGDAGYIGAAGFARQDHLTDIPH